MIIAYLWIFRIKCLSPWFIENKVDFLHSSSIMWGSKLLKQEAGIIGNCSGLSQWSCVNGKHSIYDDNTGKVVKNNAFWYLIDSLSVHALLFPLCGLLSSSQSALGNSEYCSSDAAYGWCFCFTQARRRCRHVIACLASLSFWVLRHFLEFVLDIVINLCSHLFAHELLSGLLKYLANPSLYYRFLSEMKLC